MQNLNPDESSVFISLLTALAHGAPESAGGRTAAAASAGSGGTAPGGQDGTGRKERCEQSGCCSGVPELPELR